MTTATDLVARHPALRHTGTARMHFPALLKAAEILDALKAAQGKTLSHVWGYDPNAGNKEHHSGRALDFMVFSDRAAGDFIADYIIRHQKRLGLVHVIWRQRIYRGPYSTSTNPKGVWQKMADRGNPTQNHMDHPHAWFAATGYTPLTPQEAPTRLTQTLKRGSTGSEVRLLQEMLNGLRKARLTVDGSFGPATESAVIAAHKAWGIAAPHNVVGPGFRARINAEWAKHNAPAPPMLTQTLRRGDRGSEVRLLQEMLNGLRKARLTVDGSFGPATEAAVIAAHKAWGIAAPHNVVGPGFRARINAEWVKYNEKAA